MNNEALFTKYDENGKILGYAYGEPWVAQAFSMDDINFDTEEEAREAWENYKKSLDK